MRWWSDQAASEWNRRKIDETTGGWQRNFDRLDFNLEAGHGARDDHARARSEDHRPRLDPDGKPVAGATVAPALTGTGNSLTGDTRFSVETGRRAGSRCSCRPAALAIQPRRPRRQVRQWRTWANGVLLPFRSKPGEEIGTTSPHG